MLRLEEASYPAFPIVSFLAFVLVLVPLPWHLQAWNAGTCLYMFWAAVGCLNVFINSIVWRKDILDRAPIWCDISTRIIVGVAVALPAASLCINRRLYKIATIRTVAVSRGDKYRAVSEDLAIGLGIPIVQMAVQYVVEGNRYNIFAQFGCYPAIFNTHLAYVLSLCWPTVIGLVSAVYCILSLRVFMQKRAEFQHFLAMRSPSTRSPFTIGRYFRLMALATVEVLFNTPLSVYSIVLNATGSKVQPWRGWADAHYDYWIVDKFPSAVWRSSHNAVLALELTRWGVVGCALLFFCLFGFTTEARKRYHDIYVFIRKIIGVPVKLISKGGKQGKLYYPASKDGSLPVYSMDRPPASEVTMTEVPVNPSNAHTKPSLFSAGKPKYAHRRVEELAVSLPSSRSDSISLSSTLHDSCSPPSTPPPRFNRSIDLSTSFTHTSVSDSRPPTPPPKP